MKPTFSLIAVIAILSLASCSKDDSKGNPDNPANDYPQKVKEAGEYRTTNFHLDGLGVLGPDALLHEFYAEERQNITSSQIILTEPRKQYMFLRSYSKGLYGLRYLGNCELLDPKRFYRVSGELAWYALNDSLLGKPVFEIYELATNKVYQRFIASADSCAVSIYRGAWTSGYALDTVRYRNAYNALVDTGIAKEIYEGI